MVTLVTTPVVTVTFTIHPVPLPVRALVATLFVVVPPVNEYPLPPVTISSDPIGAPCPSIIPVTL